MRLLILGGTAWLGRLLAEQAVAQGFDVTCAARGVTGSFAPGVRVLPLDRAAPGACDALREQTFDAVVDVARQPGHVREAMQALKHACQHAVFVSSVSVYADNATQGADESAPLLPRWQQAVFTELQDYGAAKVACEAEVIDAFGAARTTLMRPGLIGGPGDFTGRTGYWPRRFYAAQRLGREVLAVDEPELLVQLIDARDLCRWILDAVLRKVVGTYNAVGPATPFAEVLALARQIAGFTGRTRLAEPQWLTQQGVAPWAGPKSLPLWVPMPDGVGFGARAAVAAQRQGWTCRPLQDTLADTLAWELSTAQPFPRLAGLTDADEDALLQAFNAASGHGSA